jgi:vancomycin permeability regulator SanA
MIDESVKTRGEAKRRKRFRVPLLMVIALAIAIPGGSVLLVRLSSGGQIYSVAEVPAAPVAIVLGAGLEPDGSPKPYLQSRLEDARALYTSGKIRAILVSGDNSRTSYDEVSSMTAWLVDHGVPADRIVRDHAGFDTYDSCVRANRIFGITKAIVVTQDFHIPRAVYLCSHAGIETTGIGSPTADSGFRNHVREIPAAIKAVADVAIGPDPKFLGNHEPGIDNALRGTG